MVGTLSPPEISDAFSVSSLGIVPERDRYGSRGQRPRLLKQMDVVNPEGVTSESSHRKPPRARRPAGFGGHHASLLRTPDYRVHLPLGVLTGPGWKNFSGVITPSFLNTIPF